MRMRQSKRKRDIGQSKPDETRTIPKKKSQSEIVKSICKAKLDALNHEESLSKDNRLTYEEKRRLLDAYQERGFPVFQDTKLLCQYLPNRREADLKGLLDRLKLSLFNQISQKASSSQSDQQSSSLDKGCEVFNLTQWQNLSNKLVSKFALNKKVGLDDIYADTLMDMSNEKDGEDVDMESNCDNSGKTQKDRPMESREPSLNKLLANFGRLLEGKFPERPSNEDAAIMMRLFDDLNRVVSQVDLQKFGQLTNGSWLMRSLEPSRRLQELALEGLNSIDGKAFKKSDIAAKIDLDKSMEALCLELPKIRRITDVLNPLHIDKAMVNVLIEQLNDTSN